MSITKRIVSVQDISCVGQCSLTAALPVLSAYGIETAILPSGILSTHTGGFTGFTYHDLTEEMFRIVEHWEKEKLDFDAIYTGYIGDARQFDLILDMRKLLTKNGLLIVDPAMADHGKLYPALNEEIVEGMRKIVKESDVILPNLTEAAFLLNIPYNDNPSREEAEQMVRSLADMGPGIVILTGVAYEQGKIGAMAYEKGTGRVTEYLAIRQEKSYHGTGDLFSSVVTANILNGAPMEKNLEEACEFIVRAIKKTLPDENHPYGVHFEAVLAEDRA